jgi:hypothetical protein
MGFATVRALFLSDTPACRWCGGPCRQDGDEIVRAFPALLISRYRCLDCGERNERCHVVDPLD